MDAGSSRYPHLFSEIEVGTRTLRNRIALPATLTNFGAANRITDRWVDFLAERARGGCGLIVTEIIAVDPEALAHGAIVTGYDDANDAGFEQVAGEVQAAGSCILGQLWHPGRQQLWHPTRSPAGVSDQPDALSWTVPRVMSTEECARLVDAYVAAARRLARCGFDGVELHGAHGYLITQFLSPWSNTREDGYGGDLEGRTRFVREIAERTRDACGESFVVGFKMPADEGVEGGIDVEEAARITERLAATGAFDLFAYGQGNFSLSLENHVPDMHFRPGHFIDLHRRMRGVAGGIPVMALGRVGTPDLAERIVADGYGDLVGMTRAQVSDAAFANKAREGREEEIRPCIFDNFCWGQVHAGKPLAEFHNPHLGERGEADWAPSLASNRCRVVVVGAGPAGLEAAWIAVARGHDVHLFGAGSSGGGKLRLEARLPGHADVAKVADHQLRMAERHGVRLLLGARADEETVRRLAPDAVVVASGAKMRRPRWAWSNSILVISTIEFAAGRSMRCCRYEGGRGADHQLRMAERHGVRLLLGARADEETVRRLAPDAVVVASGAKMRRPRWAWSNSILVISTIEFAERLATPAEPSGRTAVLFDYDHTATTYAVAEALADSHDDVVLLTPRTQIAQAVNYCSALGVHRRLHGLDVEIVTATEPVEVRDDGEVRCRNVFSGHEAVIEEVDTVVYATPRRVENSLANALADLSPTLIGDCLAPRNLSIAIHEGHLVGNTL